MVMTFFLSMLMGNLSLKHYSSLLMNLFFTCVQIYGLLFLNWSGLYIIYLYWVELFFLSLYSAINYWKLMHTEALWIDQKVYKMVSLRLENTKNDFITFVFVRVVYLALYLFMIGISAVPYENNYMYVKSAARFFENLMILDPLFIVAAFFIVFFYLKLIFAKADHSKSGLIEFSFNLSHKDLRLLSPLIAILGLPLLFFFQHLIYDIGKLQHSNLYMYATLLLFVRAIIDVVYMIKLRLALKSALQA
jgi:hypothetical protein